MKKILLVALFFTVAVGLNKVSAQCARQSIRGEQIEQQKRIRHGVLTGEITRKEAAQLKAQQAHIQQTKQIAKADGVITPAERAYIRHEQNKADVNIYRQKHDAQDRW